MDEITDHDRLLTVREVCRMTRRARTTLYRDVRAGRFPPPLKIGPNRVAFRLVDVRAWVASRPYAVGLAAR